MVLSSFVRRAVTGAALAGLAVGGGLVSASPGAAAPASKPAAAAQKVDYTIQDPSFVWGGNCAVKGPAFTPLTGTGGPSRVLTGIHSGAAYQMEVPANWNGELVLWAHGYNGEGNLLCATPPPAGLRQHFVSQGYAWAASSYASNGYDVAQGVKDTKELIGLFRSRVGKAERTYMTGVSMGGHVTAVAIERYRNAFDGAMPACGVLGDKELFDYFLDANVTAAALAGAPKPAFPADPAAYATYVNTQVAPKLGTYNAPALTPNSPAGQAWGGVVQQQSGGTRPGFAGSFAYWNAFGFGALQNVPFLFGVYPGLTGGTSGVAKGNVTDNSDTVYTVDGNSTQNPVEQAINAGALRVEADPAGKPKRGLSGIPAVSGDISIPVVTLHNIGDLFVPFSMEQIYNRRVAANGASDLLTQRAIRSAGHCDFTTAEYTSAFDAMVTQVKTGAKPAGDDVLTPSVLASPSYGCRFTTSTAGTTRSFFRPPFAAPCPAS